MYHFPSWRESPGGQKALAGEDTSSPSEVDGGHCGISNLLKDHRAAQECAALPHNRVLKVHRGALQAWESKTDSILHSGKTLHQPSLLAHPRSQGSTKSSRNGVLGEERPLPLLLRNVLTETVLTSRDLKQSQNHDPLADFWIEKQIPSIR